jgi:hypothetical protein
MELKEQASPTTLAHRLGDTAHVSGLAIRLARDSGAGDRLPEWLLKVAVERGATHYQRDFDPSLPADNAAIPGGLPSCPASRATATPRPTGSCAMNNPLFILQVLDGHLDHPVELRFKHSE